MTLKCFRMRNQQQKKSPKTHSQSGCECGSATRRGNSEYVLVLKCWTTENRACLFPIQIRCGGFFVSLGLFIWGFTIHWNACWQNEGKLYILIELALWRLCPIKWLILHNHVHSNLSLSSVISSHTHNASPHHRTCFQKSCSSQNECEPKRILTFSEFAKSQRKIAMWW